MALLVAGTNSGCGKSTVTLGLMAALMLAGKTVQPFKAGPDFIDPGLHALVTGRVSRNLDIWMCGEDYVKEGMAFHSWKADATVIEGVMGYFDGDDRSTAALAKAIGAKVVLVVDAYGMAESAGALLEGFKTYSKGAGAQVDAVIFNRVGSDRHYNRLKDAVSHIDIEVLGYLPRSSEFQIPERHLGLMVAEEEPLTKKAIASLASTVSEHIDMRRVSELAQPVEPVESIERALLNDTKKPEPEVKIAIARDRAFTFYYQDNLDALIKSGAEIVPFSPLDDAELPEGIDGIYLGGGYPEMYAAGLALNLSMREAIRHWVQSGGPVYAECGGLMYLGRAIHIDGTRHEMCGALPIETELMGGRNALGYREVTPSQGLILGPLGTSIRGHEFHYSKVVSHEQAEGVLYNPLALTDGNGESLDLSAYGEPITSVQFKKTLASYTHLHWAAHPEVARHMVKFIKGDI